MKSKIEMAHDYVCAEINRVGLSSMSDERIMEAWRIADKMQAEVDKQKISSVPEVIKNSVTIYQVPQKDFTFNFDFVADQENWQPDWSQAPDGFDWWAATADSTGEVSGGWFFSKEPEIGNGRGSSIYCDGGDSVLTESFNYKGDWKDSLRKRP